VKSLVEQIAENAKQLFENNNKQLQSQLDAYKIALKYFTDQSQANADIARNLLKEEFLQT